MIRLARFFRLLTAALFALNFASVRASQTVTVATYNLENYVLTTTQTRTAKSAASRAKIRESIRAMQPDVLAVQEIGDINALLDLQTNLKAEGVDYPHWEHVSGFDTNIYVAVLSKFPIVARRSHTNESFLLRGRRFRSSRGFAEIDIQVNPKYTFTLFAAHLKSRRQSAEADESEWREEEARLLREKVDAALARTPHGNVIVLGDFNDVKDSRSTRMIIGRGKTALTDARPSERNGDNLPNPIARFEPRNITWTHYYGKEDTYSRIDYILISQGMAREWQTNGTYVLSIPNWGLASDHRPIIATFVAQDQ